MAVAKYREAEGHYPPAYVVGPDGRPWHSWRVLILPYVGEQSLYDRYRFDEPWDGPNNRTLVDHMPKLFAFPSTNAEGKRHANYLAVVGPETMWPGEAPYQGEPGDGAAATVLLVENHGLDVGWMEPRDLKFEDMSFELQRPNGVSSRYRVPAVATLDGALYSLPHPVRPAVFRAMFTADGGEPLDPSAGGWQWLDDGRNRVLAPL